MQERLSTEEKIEILQKNGIQVIWKPVALMPFNFHHGIELRIKSGGIEMNIDDAMSKLRVRKILAKDPFSEK